MDGRDGNSFQGPGDQRWEGVLDPAAGYRCLPLDHTLWPLTEPLHPLDQRMEQLYASTVICKEIVFYMTIQIDPSWFKIWGIIPKQILLYCQQITLNFCTWMGNICPGFKLFTLWLWMKCFCLFKYSFLWGGEKTIVYSVCPAMRLVYFQCVARRLWCPPVSLIL